MTRTIIFPVIAGLAILTTLGIAYINPAKGLIIDKSAFKQFLYKVFRPLEIALEVAGIPTCIGAAIWWRIGEQVTPYIAAVAWTIGVTLAIVRLAQHQSIPRFVFVTLYCLYGYVIYLALVTLRIV
jgi:hypothetical protein